MGTRLALLAGRLNDSGLIGGRLNDMFNYVYAQLDRRLADGDNVHIFQTRFHVDF